MFNVYVIEVSDEKGPRINPRYANVYVGQTALTPEERFERHRIGHKTSHHLWKGGKRNGKFLGLWLKRRLYEKYNPIATRKEAETTEEWLADHLRRRGYTVFVGLG